MSDLPQEPTDDGSGQRSRSMDPLDDFDRKYPPQLSVEEPGDAVEVAEIEAAEFRTGDDPPTPESSDFNHVLGVMDKQSESTNAAEVNQLSASSSFWQERVDTSQNPELENVMTSDAKSAEQSHLVADLGIVFVHGMGSSKPGNTLVQFLNPTLDWIKRVTTGDHHFYANNDIDTNLVDGVNILERKRSSRPTLLNPSGEIVQAPPNGVDIVSVRKAILESASMIPTGFVPPYVEVQLSGSDINSGVIDTRMIVAIEAWWDGEFEPPPFKDVAYWALGVAPCFILRHLAQLWEMDSTTDANTISSYEHNNSNTSGVSGARKASRVTSRWLKAVLPTFFGGLIALIIQWIICLLLVIGSIPFLEKYVKAIILKLTSSFGDVFVYVNDGIRSAAIRSTVERSIEWLLDRYEVHKLIVVGYSLGSVIAYDVLNRRDVSQAIKDPQGTTFVTLGSPLKRANILVELKRDEQRMALGIPLAFSSLVCGLISLILVSSNHSDNPVKLDSWLLSASILGTALGFGLGAHARPSPKLHGLALSVAQQFAAVLGLLVVVPVTLFHVLDFEQTSGTKWVLVGLVFLSADWFILSLGRIHSSRCFPSHFPGRYSPFLMQGFALLTLTAVAICCQLIEITIGFFLAAVIFAIMTGSNPLEEFGSISNVEPSRSDSSGDLDVSHKARLDRHARFIRRMPKFAFGTQIKMWHDFWAEHDLVAEFGLGDIRYRSSGDKTEEFQAIPKSRRLTNLNMYTRDHTVYHTNREQFIAPMSRLFLEELNFRKPSFTRGSSQGFWSNLLGHVRVEGDYEKDITRAMHTRSRRVLWMNVASIILMCIFLGFSPKVYRSLGELIVFDNIDTSVNITQEAMEKEADIYRQMGMQSVMDLESTVIDKSVLQSVYDEFFREDGDNRCIPNCVRHLPLIPEDFTDFVVGHLILRSIIVYTIGYGIVFVVFSLSRTILVIASWRTWESAILDTVVERRSGISWNRFSRATAFTLLFIAVMALAISIHSGLFNGNWLNLGWMWSEEITPVQTAKSFWDTVGWSVVHAVSSGEATNGIKGAGR